MIYGACERVCLFAYACCCVCMYVSGCNFTRCARPTTNARLTASRIRLWFPLGSLWLECIVTHSSWNICVF